ncbi:glycosyltransferase family 2 protein [Dysgonomonas sp. Marseille-P4677]|uniref:glycosyltransferase family 2 protein n=1 Tax=Dysgonomonas sp. Marseille-P4677 TaxID=2364790 RepID=UPI0019146100|nr:glycosyltransferase family A protein [Dysgonomonas sp. Marseille-P4677]MBK5721757.1 glycosyltransferase family 2 protein [Dysgonomonas sp. Marseille-P4677]
MVETINNTNTLPVISVIVPCYNQAEYLAETLQSVLDQEYQAWECIIINDGSPDNTQEVAKIWIDKDPRFKYYQKENGGLSDARNFGISHAIGKYILPLDSDDKIGPQYIIEALNTFERKPETKVVYSNLILFGTKNQKLNLPPFRYKDLLTENRIFCSAIYRKSDYMKTNGYNPNMVGGLEDWNFWLELIKEADVVVKLDKYHFYYRIKDASMLSSLSKEKNEQLLLQIFKNHVPLYLKYFNPIRDHIDADYFKKEAELYKNSIEYKTGAFLYAPIKFIRKVFRKMFSSNKSY